MVAMNRQEPGRSRKKAGGASAGADVQILGRVKDGASELVQSVKEGARAAKEQIAETAGEVTRNLSQTMKGEAERLFEQQRGRAVSKVKTAGKVAHQTAHAMRAVRAEPVAEYVDEAARLAERVADYLQERSWPELVKDAQAAVRRYEAAAVAGLFLAGFALARFARAGAAYAENEGNPSPDRPDGKERHGGRRSRRRKG